MNALPRSQSTPGPDSAMDSSNLRLRIGDHVVDLGALRVLTRPAAPRLTSKAAAVLCELVRHAGDTVTRDHLLGSVWKNRVTTPDVLTQAIKELRRAFADDTKPSRYIETIPKVGYRLVVSVQTIDVASLPDGLAPVRPPFAIHAGQRHSANMHEIADDARAAPLRSRDRPWFPIAWWALGLAGVVALVLVGAAIVFAQGSWRHAGASQWQAIHFRAVTSDPGAERRPRISPDGTRVAYSQLDPASGFERVVVRSVDQSQLIHLSSRVTASEELPTWSPDGTQIAFERIWSDHSCTLYVAPSLGSTDTELGDCGNYVATYFDWTPDGKSLITSTSVAQASNASVPPAAAAIAQGNARDNMPSKPTRAARGALALTLLDVASGEKRPLQYKRSPSDQDLEARYSPDGRLIAFRRGLAPHSDLFLMGADGSAQVQLTHLSARILGYTWTRDGRGLVFSSDTQGISALYVVHVADGRVEPLNVTSAAYPDAARAVPAVVYEIVRTKNTLAEVALGAQSQTPHLMAPSTGNDTAPALAPDGKRVAFVSDRSGSQQVWLYGLDGGQALALTDFRGAAIWNCAWSADGRRLLITVREDGKTSLVEIDLASRRLRSVAASQRALLNASFGLEPGSYLVTRRALDGASELAMLLEADTPNEHAIPIATSVEHAEIDSATRMIYFTRSDVPGVFRRDLAGGNETLITTNVDSMTREGWRVVDGKIWYVTKLLAKPFDLREFDPTTGIDRQLVSVESSLREFNFSVAPTRDRVIFTPAGPEDIDVGAFDLAPSTEL
jgi:Tol biopolymer transport system component/DNA-binding winged helix-turn-helix (wHTH) protein